MGATGGEERLRMRLVLGAAGEAEAEAEVEFALQDGLAISRLREQLKACTLYILYPIYPYIYCYYNIARS